MLKHVTFSLVGFFLGLNSAVALGTRETYIVTLKPYANLNTHVTQRREGFEIKHVYDAVLNGYAAELSPSALKALRVSGDVQGIEKDQVVSIAYNTKRNRSLDFDSRLGKNHLRPLTKKATGGTGVDIYIVDTGITITKSCFGGRAVWGASFGGYGTIDGSGHGTAMAASAICAETGATATASKAIAVKVLSDAGSGSVSDIIAGVNYIKAQYSSTQRPSIGVLAIGGSASSALDSAVTSLIDAGVHVAVTAGFSATNVINFSPARVAGAITVGSLPRTKAFPSNSNYGPGLDVWSFYPTACPSDIGGCTTPTNAVSYVASYLAVGIGEYGNKTPTALTADLVNYAVPDVTGAPSGTTNRRAMPW